MSKCIVLLLILFSSLISCSSVEKDIEEKNSGVDELIQIATEKYKNNFNIEYNSNKDFALCIHKNKTNIPGPESINFFVYDLSNDKITYESNISKGNVSWNSEYELKIEEIPGTIQKNMPQSSVYILNVKTNTKTKINGDKH